MSSTLFGSSAVDAERDKQTSDGNDGKPKPKNDLIGFGKSVVSALVITFIWAILGCNFMYLQNYVSGKDKPLGELFPADAKAAPYSDGSEKKSRDFARAWAATKTGIQAKSKALQQGFNARKGKEGSVTNQAGGAIDVNKKALFEKVTGLTKYSSPYNWKSGEEGLFGDFKAWIANSVEFSYVNGRGLINKMFDLTHGLTKVSPALVLLFSVPIVAIVTQLAPFYGFLSTLVGEVQAPNKGWIWALIFLFVLGFDFILAGFVGFLQTVQTFFTFIALPVMLDSSGVFTIMGEHHQLFTGMFGFFVIANAFAYLQTEASIVMLLTYLWLLYRNYKAGQNPQ